MRCSRTVDPAAVKQHLCRRSDAWDDDAAGIAEISHFDWPDPRGPENGPQGVHRPRVVARTKYDETYLSVRFEVEEDSFVRCARTQWCEQVCEDSCCEFFVAPAAESDARTSYINFEVNAAGTMLAYHCVPGSETQALSMTDAASILVSSSLDPKRTTAADAGRAIDPEITATYGVEIRVPWHIFRTYFGVEAPPPSGSRWRCNFYKCGDKTSHPHWGSWAPVGSERPNFHRPADFQQLAFE